MLANALSNGKGLDFITGTACNVGILETVDDRLVAMLDAHFDEMVFDGKWHTIVAMKYVGTPAARTLLERVFNNSRYDEVLFPNTRPGLVQQLSSCYTYAL